MSNRLLLLFNEPRVQPQELLAPARVSYWKSIQSAWRRQRSRRRIAQLDSHMLKDMGITWAEAEAEANKPFWRP